MEAQAIFKLMQEESGFDDEKMFRKFNMGMGFFVITDSKNTDRILAITSRYDVPAARVGEVRAYEGGPRVHMPRGSKKPLNFVGYG